MIPSPPMHPSVERAQEAFQSDLVTEVSQVVATEKVVVVGVMGLGPGRRARSLLDAQKIPYRYLEYGSYFRGWRRRLALKLWVRWPTFPLVFINGTFIGGGSDLKRLIDAGELTKLLS